MIFSSDNWAGAHPLIAESLVKAASGYASAYGTSDLDKAVEKKLSEVFEREVAVFFVGTGTAANSLAIASANRPGGHTFCHTHAHVNADECGAPEFFAHGSRLAPVDGLLGRMDPEHLKTAIRRTQSGGVHGGQPMAITLTQATEAGTVYSLDEIQAISAIARSNDLPLHMDGARFANALVTLGATPAEMTWMSGIDLLSFGGTKNGCWCAEALILFDTAKAREMSYLRKRSAQLFSKSRFIAAQFDAYLQDELWLDLARHANAMAAKLAEGIARSNSARLAWPSGSNELFVILNAETAKTLQDKGAVFYDWPAPQEVAATMDSDEGLYRLVTSFATTQDDVGQFLATC
ncbi:threonine aldolase family protein [Pararhizobium antarcticum]|uniref:L-threonine aldolase n=1 Tax=Pararhizobium antarcticum TaxID=1798805 RepID=A0A657LY28_9HYPH|nr:low specificity L-threonine aldolase [Pararhizobium antarcticum]OJF96642.1 threonine aldolase [Rhizobium sp. 58]OJG01351.1 threonine aldolase [Pararhizobium antarcticum]